jgi:hypothetical protein
MADDARLQALYRRLTASAALPQSDDLAQVLGRAGFPDEEGTPLDRVAASSLQADLLRTVMALEQDADELRRGVAALRAPRRAAGARRWLAAAAALGAVAVLVTGLRPGTPPPAAPADATHDMILSASFESAPASRDPEPPIFAASFDS